jgi:hypothetical protein
MRSIVPNAVRDFFPGAKTTLAGAGLLLVMLDWEKDTFFAFGPMKLLIYVCSQKGG